MTRTRKEYPGIVVEWWWKDGYWHFAIPEERVGVPVSIDSPLRWQPQGYDTEEAATKAARAALAEALEKEST